MKICSVKNCNNKLIVKGLCKKHYQKQWEGKNRNHRAKYKKQYRQDNKEHHIKYDKQRYQDKEEYFIEYRKNNKKQHAKSSKRWREEHKEHLLQYRINNKEHFAEWYKQYRQNPSGKAILMTHRHNYRLLTKGLTKEIIQRVYKDNCEKYGVLTCILCSKHIEFGDDSLEHLIPISRGGTNDYDNLGISHIKCNKKKYTKTLTEWFNNKKGE